jgi:DNA helicase-4
MGRYRRQERKDTLGAFKKPGGNLDAEFGTVHSSKGLEADYVVLDRVEGPGFNSFPSVVLDDSVLRLVVPEREPFPNAEERRLMYVALTRARHRVYILTKGGNESTFVRELESSKIGTSGPVHACPRCKGGVRVLRNGKRGPFWGCSRYPECTSTAPKR